jgi:hypothetical protein
LRGDQRGSIDRVREGRGGPIEPSDSLVEYDKQAMTEMEARLNLGDTFLVLKAIQETCFFRRWPLLAAHVRSTHWHLVVGEITDTRGAIRDFKAYASRALNRDGVRRWWARGGNVQVLGDSFAVQAAVRYIADGQGPPMAVYVAPERLGAEAPS